MKTLFTIDLHDYNENGRKVFRPSVRGIIMSGDKIAMAHSRKRRYYKFPGGGIEPGEDHICALEREVKEETGLTVIPGSIREFGNVLRIQKGNEGPDVIFVQENFYYLCEVENTVGEQALDPYEKEAEFELSFVTIEEAIRENEAFKSDDLIEQLMIDRERRVLELLV